MSRWTEEQVLATAPDASSVAAGKKLAVPGPWSDTGANETLVWGKCQGSGKTPYQTSVDIVAPAYRCSCPSRKFPCKHAIALLLLWARGVVGDEVAMADFAKEWADQRSEKAEAKAKKAETPVDPEAQAKRLAERIAKMDAGVDDFTLWLTDLARGGLAAARAQPYSYWDRAAARLVDAQLPGLADRVRTLGEESLSRDDWAEHMLRHVGRLRLLTQAWKRRDRLTEADQADLRATLGLTTPTEQVRAGRTRAAQWQVMGAHRSDNGPLQQQRTWLRADDGELGLLLETAGPGQVLGVPQLSGARLQATVAFYPGNAPQRILFVDQPEALAPAESIGQGGSIAQATRDAAAGLAVAPWRTRHPLSLTGIRHQADPPAALDPDGTGILLDPEVDIRMLMAITGGHPCDAFGELEEGRLRILAISAAGAVNAS